MNARNETTDKPMRRQYVKFSVYEIDPAWRRLDPSTRESGKDELCRIVQGFSSRLFVKSYSLIGMRGDADFLLWQIADRLEDIRDLSATVYGSRMGAYLHMPHSFLAMTRRSIYVSPDDPHASRLIITPTAAKYLFVYPFVKTRAWYKLSKDTRQAMMDDHIAIGRKYPSVKLNTTYSYGLDDQEFVVAFETDEPSDFLDLVMELREAEASSYTERDTPIFTCIAMELREALDSLGATVDKLERLPRSVNGHGDEWVRVLSTAEVPDGASKVVYLHGDQIAVFNIDGKVYAVSNRCPHANGPISDGKIDGTVVTCPLHNSRFDLISGEPLQGPANKPLTRYQVKVEDSLIFIASAYGASDPERTLPAESR